MVRGEPQLDHHPDKGGAMGLLSSIEKAQEFHVITEGSP